MNQVASSANLTNWLIKNGTSAYYLRHGEEPVASPRQAASAILQAALVEFAQEGLAGARMDAIAAAAGVNKALLYYYFRDKEALYDAVLDDFFVRLLGRVTQALDGDGSGRRTPAHLRARTFRLHRRISALRQALSGRADERRHGAGRPT